MKVNRKNTVIILTSFLIVACAGAESRDKANESAVYDGGGVYASEPSYGYEENSAAEESYGNATDSEVGPDAFQNREDGLTDETAIDRKLIKNANLSFETDSLEQRKKIIDEAVKKFDAYVEHEEQYMESDREVVETSFRVPSNHFDEFMEMTTKGVGAFDSKTIEVDDVTEEFVDVEARIKTKKELKVRFTALLDKAESIAKIMEIEREITALQAEIESFEGRLKYLSGNVKYASIKMTYYRVLELPTEFDNKFESAFKNGWRALVWFFVGVVAVWPIFLLLSIALIVLKWRLKVRKAKV